MGEIMRRREKSLASSRACTAIAEVEGHTYRKDAGMRATSAVAECVMSEGAYLKSHKANEIGRHLSKACCAIQKRKDENE
ncbi:hypothetical protein GCM10010306_104930 [Streptomyces umbrinus]|uniref:hypothetical protein n=1 Tax=Streptomyces umbrinus TaxID=67370 RepID=UPI001677A468|nr:hypothetical protein [Streptomyces umbrinus]GHB92934.1 hypothetical protein GCM10010306_104930 [Streptomyces umbrinus]